MFSITKTWLLWAFSMLSSFSLWAQSQTQVTIKAGNKVSDHLAFTDIYYLPQFTSGKVIFKDGTQVEAQLNYSLLVDEMHFIDRKGDTLALANENTTKFITIGKDTFYYNQGYLRQILQNKEVILALKQVWALGDIRKIGAFNLTNTVGAIETISTFAGKGGNYNLILNEDIDLKKVEQFVLGDRHSHFRAADKKNLLQLFPKKQQAVKGYLQENKVDFGSKEDLVKLVQFLAAN